MATKKLGEDMEEVKKSLNFMSDELSKVAKQQICLLDLIEEVRQLKAVIKEKDKKIEDLERRVEDLEQYTRMDDLVISGLQTTHRTYARTTAGDKEGEDAPRGVVQMAPTAKLSFQKQKQELELAKQKIASQEDKIIELTRERDFLREQLSKSSQASRIINDGPSPDPSVMPASSFDSSTSAAESCSSTDDYSSDSSSSTISSDNVKKKRKRRRSKNTKKKGKKRIREKESKRNTRKCFARV